jgi:hypothetical protein
MNIIYGFNEKASIEKVNELLENKGIEVFSQICATKLDVLYEVLKNPNIDCIILNERKNNENNWSAYEMARLTDGRNINIIPILKEETFENKEFLATIFSANITSAVFGKVNIADIVELALSKRSRREAISFYELEKTYPDNHKVTGAKLDRIKNYLNRASDYKVLMTRFDNVCSELNLEQIEDLMKKISAEQRKFIKGSKTYKAINNDSKKREYHEIIDFPSLGENVVEKRDYNLLLGFKKEKIENYIPNELEEIGYDVHCKNSYTKAGVLDYVHNNPDLDGIVLVENIEQRGGFTQEELFDISISCNGNIVILLQNDKKGTEYVEKIYSGGLVSAVIATGINMKDIIELLLNKRTRQDARKEYGIHMGLEENFVLCEKYKKNIQTYLKAGNYSFEERADFIKQLLNNNEIKELANSFNDNVLKKLVTKEDFFDNKTNKKLIKKLDMAEMPLLQTTQKARRKMGFQENNEESPDKLKKENLKSKGGKKDSEKIEDNWERRINDNAEKKILEKEKAKNIDTKIDVENTERKQTKDKADKENKEEKDKNNIIKSQAKKSKFNLRKIDWAIIGSMAIFSVVMLGMFFSTRNNSNASDGDGYEDTTQYEEAVVTYEETVNYDATTVIETTNVVETTTLEGTTTKLEKKQSVKKKVKRKKKKVRKSVQPETTIKRIVKVEQPTKKIVRTTKVSKPIRTTPQVKRLGSYSESNAISTGKISNIRNSVSAKLSGGQNSEKMNLAKYMSANGLSNASSTYKSLTNETKNFSCRVASTSVESDSNDNIIKAARKLANRIGSVSGGYGIGVSSFRKTVGYKIYVVVVY